MAIHAEQVKELWYPLVADREPAKTALKVTASPTVSPAEAGSHLHRPRGPGGSVCCCLNPSFAITAEDLLRPLSSLGTSTLSAKSQGLSTGPVQVLSVPSS